ncbi:MAG TPA: TlpA disulfide reductase family protein [Usitatibacter sp.]|nr:TlpA disulfide reductase family protein [Usitatibacter sp.]
MRGLVAAVMLALSPVAASVEAGAGAPNVALASLEDPGAVVRLSRFRGSVVYVDFWASWCVPCRTSMPVLDELYAQHGGLGLAVIGVNKDTLARDAHRFLEKVPVHFMLVTDADDAAARAFDVKAMPSGYLLDRKGVVRRVHRGFTAETAGELRREVEALLKEPG